MLYRHLPSRVALLTRTTEHLTVPELVLLLESQPIWSPGVGRILPVCVPRCWQVALLSSRFRARETHQLPVEITRDETNIYQSLHTLLPVQSKSQQKVLKCFCSHRKKSGMVYMFVFPALGSGKRQFPGAS